MRRSLALFILSLACSSEVASRQDNLRVTGQGPPTAADMQYETGTSVQTFNNGQINVDVTYNDETGERENNFVQYPSGSRIAFAGYSSLGYSVSTNGGNSFIYQPVPKLRPPNYGNPGGWDALWGDPGITRSRFDQHFVYISSLAISHTSMQNAGGSIIGSVEFGCGTFPNCHFCGPIDGACIARSNDGGVTFMPIQPVDCFTNSGHFYDGGSMESDLNGGIYASFNDVSNDTEAVWYAPSPVAPFALLPSAPFAGFSMVSHPRLRYDYQTGRLYIMGLAAILSPPFNLCSQPQTQDGQFVAQLLIDYWNGTSWHGAVAIGNADTIDNPHVNRGPILGSPGQIRRAGQFSFDVGTPSVLANDDIRIVYTSERNTPNRMSLISYVCTRDLVCTNVGFAWSTQYSHGQQFDPVVVAQPFFITVPAVWALSYNSTEFEPNDNVNTTISFMRAQLKVDSGGHYVPWAPNWLVVSTPLCPEKDGQWGDYDDLRVLQIINNIPIFIRTHTESTDQCQSRDTFIASPMHVSSQSFSF